MFRQSQKTPHCGVLIHRTVVAVGLACLCAMLAACGGAAAHVHLPTPTATHSAVIPGSLVVRSCAGPSISTIPSATIIVNGHAQSTPLAARVGDTIQIRLPSSAQRWNEIGTPNATLTPLAIQAAYDASLHLCVWAFQAEHTGTATVQFDGQPLCEPTRPCANYVLNITVSFVIS